MSRIRVTISCDRFLVWNDDDVLKLRSNWRIIGSLIGVHPENHFQSDELGLPLELSKYEVKLLLEQNAIDLFQVHITQLTSEEKEEYEKSNQAAFEKYKEAILKEREASIISNREAIIQKARERRNLGPSVTDQEIIDGKLKEASESITFDKFHLPFHKDCQFDSRMRLIENYGLTFPVSDECKYQVFRQLWLKGYFITTGHKFACDFLAYEGDPKSYHAKYMVLCKIEGSEDLELEIAMKGRLSVQVNKELLIGRFCSESKNVNFSLVSWEGK